MGIQAKESWKEVDQRQATLLCWFVCKADFMLPFLHHCLFHPEIHFIRSRASSLLLPDRLTHYREMNSNCLKRSCLFYLPTYWQATTKFFDGIPSYKLYCITATIPPLALFPEGSVSNTPHFLRAQPWKCTLPTTLKNRHQGLENKAVPFLTALAFLQTPWKSKRFPCIIIFFTSQKNQMLLSPFFFFFLYFF